MIAHDIDNIIRDALTPEQANAALDDSKEILCIACAGSGKSRTLAYRLARLLAKGEDPAGIVAFTFTEKAAESIKRRVSQALTSVGLSTNLIGQMYIGTIHSYCQHVLGQADAIYRQFDVLDENKLILFMMSRYNEIGLPALRNTRNARYFDTLKKAADAFKLLNDEYIDISTVASLDVELGETIVKLKDIMRRDQFIDFSTMIRTVVEKIESSEDGMLRTISHLKHLLVDEYQDISPTQDRLIRLLHKLSDTLFVVGDDDQAIYGWRGADVSNILQFDRRYPSSVKHVLSINFRSTETIVCATSGFVAAQLGAMRLDKNPSAKSNESPRQFGVHWFKDRIEEAEWVADRIASLIGTEYVERDGAIRGLTPADFAILMRSTRTRESDLNPRHMAFTSMLHAKHIPYSLEAGGGAFDRPEVQVLRNSFLLLRERAPTRSEALAFFNTEVQLLFPQADFDSFAALLTRWAREIHAPFGGVRRRVFPQNLVFELLQSFGVGGGNIGSDAMRDIGLFSRMIQDVESVYLSIDSSHRFTDILNFLENVADTGYDVSTDDVVLRPDAVTVATVHKVKGLEYPVVFVVDVEQGRFPGIQRKYDGWLPTSIIETAIKRGAYVGTPEEEARLFYTAATRAERYLYVTGAENLPAGKRRRKQSSYVLALSHAEITKNQNEVPSGLVLSTGKRRMDESILPTSFSDVRYYLGCPMDYRFRKGFGFSPSIPEMFGFGRAVHVAIEKLHEIYRDHPPTREQAELVADNAFHLKHIAPSRDPENRPGPYENAKNKAKSTVAAYVETYKEDFQQQRQVEARFEIPANDCLITGSIDLLLKEDESGKILEAHVIDFKAIAGGDDPNQNPDLDWTELSLQVQLYAKAARDVLGENAATGSIHLLKDNQRVGVPIDEHSVNSAIKNVEWAVQGILLQDFPMRPHPKKCVKCDFDRICPKLRQDFDVSMGVPPSIVTPSGPVSVRSFSLFK